MPTQDELLVRLKDYQDALEEAERAGPRRFEKVFADPPEGILVHEFDAGGLLRVNREELRILGYREEQMIGRPIWEFAVMEGASRESVQKKLAGEKDLYVLIQMPRSPDTGRPTRTDRPTTTA